MLYSRYIEDKYKSMMNEEQLKELNCYERLNEKNSNSGIRIIEENKQNINVGDIFTYGVGDRSNIYFYGRVISKNENPIYGLTEKEDLFCVELYTNRTDVNDMKRFKSENNSLMYLPIFIESDYFYLGYFNVVGNLPLEKEIKDRELGFIHIASKYDYDMKGNLLTRETQYVGHAGYIFRNNVNYAIDKRRVIQPSLFSLDESEDYKYDIYNTNKSVSPKLDCKKYNSKIKRGMIFPKNRDEYNECIDELEECGNTEIIKFNKIGDNHNISIGAVFLLSQDEGVYYYGKVIDKYEDVNRRGESVSVYIVLIFENNTNSISIDNYKPDYNKLLIPPAAVLSDYFDRGEFYIISDEALNEKDTENKYGFYGYGETYSETFNDLNIDYFIGISLENGIELEVKKKLIAYPKLKKVK